MVAINFLRIKTITKGALTYTKKTADCACRLDKKCAALLEPYT
jgi:hypothetical protein